jgi:hypothetical protein
MSTYRMSDGMIVRTENATKSWVEDTKWNGNNHISVATGSQWDHQKLHRSRKGRYYIESWSAWQGTVAMAEWVDNREAVRWLLENGHDLPDDLESIQAEIEE